MNTFLKHFGLNKLLKYGTSVSVRLYVHAHVEVSCFVLYSFSTTFKKETRREDNTVYRMYLAAIV